MRKLVPFLLFLSFFAEAQNFTPGNLVVVRIGDGSIPLSNGNAAPIFLDEYTQSGTLVRSLALPASAAGINKICTADGASTLEGTLNISADGKYLTTVGYNAAPNTAGGTVVGGIGSGGTDIDNSSPAIINRVVALVDYMGNINTQTALSDAYDKTNIRSAVTDNGSNLWLAGGVYASATGSAGVRYTALGGVTSTKISSGFDNERMIGIADNQLFVTGGTNGYQTVNKFGAGLPITTGQTAVNLSGIPSGSQTSPNGFIFFDMDPTIPGPDLLYVCDDKSPDDGNQGLKKYSFDGTAWTGRGRLTNRCSSVTGYIGCDGKVVLFVTADLTTSLYEFNNKIYKLVDDNGYNASIAGNGTALSGAAVLIADVPGVNKVFRGIQMAPGNGLTITGTATIATGNYNKIIIKNGANLTLSGNVAIADKMVVETGATLDCANFTIGSVAGTSGYFELQPGATLKIGSVNGIAATAASGNIQTCQRRFSSGGNYEYNASVAQNTGDGLPAIISGKLILNNTANIVLSANVKVSSTVDFKAGRLQTTAANSITVTSSTQYTRYGTGYFQTAEETSFIDGPAKFESSANTYRFVPVGKGSHFAPVGITPYNSAIKTYHLEYFPIAPIDYLNIGGFDHISQLEYWDIACSATTNPDMDAKITLYWSPNSVVGHGGDDAHALADLRIAHYENTGGGTKWQMDGAAASGFTTSGTINYGSIMANDYATHFSPFTLASSSYRNILPLRLLQFSATQTNGKVTLNWQTANETDMDYFTAEHSQDGLHFTAFKKLLCTNNPGVNIYTVIDENPLPGIGFYRLAMVGKDSKTDYSAIEKIWTGEEKEILLYPNPAKDFINIRLPRAEGNLLLTDVVGKPIRKITVTSNLMQLELQDLVAGTYYIFYEGIRGKARLKFVRVR